MYPRIPFAFALGLTTLTAAPSSIAAPWDKPGWALTFHDEFDGTSVDDAAWVKRYKWGEAVINQELQAYVDDAFSFENGVLHIVGTHAPGEYAGQTLEYRSGVLSSAHEQRYGWFEVRCRMPAGQGLWPAFWLLGKNGSDGVNEIDIHEFLGHDPNTIYTTIHWGSDYGTGHQSNGDSHAGPDFTSDFHTFAVDWDADRVIWYVDGAETFRHEGEGVPQVEMYIITNLAIGGGWPGAPDDTTAFPAHYQVDYIRAYERAPDPPDAGPLEDGSSQDAASADASPEADPQEASVDADANEARADAVATDAPPLVDAPTEVSTITPTPDDDGCACRLTPARSGGPPRHAALGFLAIFVALWRRPISRFVQKRLR